MWIRTQDKEQLLQITNFSVVRNYGGKDKFALLGIIFGKSYRSQSKILGLYKTKLEAIQELDSIQKCIASNDKEIYQVS